MAVGINAEATVRVLGFDVITTEDGARWLAFLRGLVARGLNGTALVISDAHPDLVDAVRSTLTGATWQRCRTHFMCNLLTPRYGPTRNSTRPDGTITPTRQVRSHWRRAHWLSVRVATRDQDGRIIGDRHGEPDVDWHYEGRWIHPLLTRGAASESVSVYTVPSA